MTGINPSSFYLANLASLDQYLFNIANLNPHNNQFSSRFRRQFRSPLTRLMFEIGTDILDKPHPISFEVLTSLKRSLKIIRLDFELVFMRPSLRKLAQIALGTFSKRFKQQVNHEEIENYDQLACMMKFANQIERRLHFFQQEMSRSFAIANQEFNHEKQIYTKRLEILFNQLNQPHIVSLDRIAPDNYLSHLLYQLSCSPLFIQVIEKFKARYESQQTYEDQVVCLAHYFKKIQKEFLNDRFFTQEELASNAILHLMTLLVLKSDIHIELKELSLAEDEAYKNRVISYFGQAVDLIKHHSRAAG